MWIYEKKLQFPIDVKSKDLKFAKTLIAQYGGPAGELTACLQYLNQRFTMPTGQTRALLTDIGAEDTILATKTEIKKSREITIILMVISLLFYFNIRKFYFICF